MINFWLDKKEEVAKLPVFDVNDMAKSADALFADIPYDEHLGRKVVAFIKEPVNTWEGLIWGEVEVSDYLFEDGRSIYIQRSENSDFCGLTSGSVHYYQGSDD